MTLKLASAILVESKHVLLLVTVCVLGVASSGTENVSEKLPSSSTAPLASSIPSSHRNVTVPDLQ